MNSLARVIHNLVTGKTEPVDIGSRGLSPQEQTALEHLSPVLRLSPREVVTLLEKATAPLDWASTPRPVEKASRGAI